MKKSNSNNNLEISEPAVRHEGIVTKISQETITISLKGNINCEGCKAKSACGVSESNDKEIEVVKSTTIESKFRIIFFYSNDSSF